MSSTTIHEAEPHLAELIDRAMNGEEIIIARAGRPMVRLTPIAADEAPRVGGQWRGRVRIDPDFDALPADIAVTIEGREPIRLSKLSDAFPPAERPSQGSEPKAKRPRRSSGKPKTSKPKEV